MPHVHFFLSDELVSDRTILILATYFGFAAGNEQMKMEGFKRFFSLFRTMQFPLADFPIDFILY